MLRMKQPRKTVYTGVAGSPRYNRFLLEKKKVPRKSYDFGRGSSGWDSADKFSATVASSLYNHRDGRTI